MLTGHQTQGMLFAGLECFQNIDSIMYVLQMSGDPVFVGVFPMDPRGVASSQR